MYKIILFLFILFILFFTTMKKEEFRLWDYEYPLNRWSYRDKCPIQGTIDEYNNPIRCFEGYYIPSIFNVATYESEVNPDA